MNLATLVGVQSDDRAVDRKSELLRANMGSYSRIA